MELNFGPKGYLEFDDARIVFRNFTGVKDKFNAAGDRNFAIIIPDEEMADALIADGWNVKKKEDTRDPDAELFMYLPVKIRFTDRSPNCYLKSGNRDQIKLTEDTIGMLDEIDIARVDLDIRPYDWTVNGKTGRTAYLQGIRVVQDLDRFAEMDEDR